MGYTIQNNKILSDILEINVVDHCNLSCRSCTHLSPISRKKQVEPGSLILQLSCLSNSYHASKLRLLGGEPLLHKNIHQIIFECRNSFIADQLVIVTNGQVPEKITDDLLISLDGLEISLYPGFGFKGNLEKIKERCSQFNCSLRITEYKFFRESYSEYPNENTQLIKKVYDTCQVAHLWGCHNLEAGYFYKCPQAHVLKRSIESNYSIPEGSDGISVFSENLFERLKEYLESSSPLMACRNCLGSVGNLFEHEQIKRNNWAKQQKNNFEKMVDFDFLYKLENENPDAYTDCYKDLYKT